MGTLVSDSIYTTDHFAAQLDPDAPYTLQNNIGAFRLFDWIGFRGQSNTWYLRTQNLEGAANFYTPDIGVLKITPKNINVGNIGIPLNSFYRQQPLNPCDLVYGAYVPGVGNFGNNHDQNHSSITPSLGYIRERYSDWLQGAGVGSDSRVRSDAYIAIWHQGEYRDGESGSGIFSSSLEFIGVMTAGIPDLQQGDFTVIDRLLNP
jgi:hypothetical protein